jgi:endonuclease YncB( thermonuclease family)
MVRPAIAIALAVLLSLSAGASVPVGEAARQHFAALDGDTVVADGAAVRIAGIDAPELGPWARCWAEAALAGHAREALERLLGDRDRGGWSLSDVSKADARGRRTARLVDRDGYDIADDMVVYGHAARTGASWDWCGSNANLHQVLEGEPPPHGPNLWWPTAHMYDPRAAD